MKSKKGFTLIELLAVIVILAIIALIATPIILNIINDSKKSSDERSAELYIDAVEKAVARKNLNEEFSPSSCEIQTNGNIICDSQTKEIKIEVKGSKPTSGTIVFEKLKIKEATMKLNNKEINFENGKITSNPSITYKKYENGEEVYFDVDTGSKCTNYTEAQSNTGVNRGCMKFYAFNDDGGDKLNLILDHNTTATIAWNSSGSNKNGPSDTFLNKLKADTKDWKGTLPPENYTIDQSSQTSGAKYTIDYVTEEYKARIITAQEIAQIVGYDSWSEISSASQSFYFFDLSNSLTTGGGQNCVKEGCEYGWLYDRTGGCLTLGCYHDSNDKQYGYWTISSKASDTLSAWDISYRGYLDYDGGGTSTTKGLRPVIEVLKSNLQ